MEAELPYAGFRPGQLTGQQEKFVHLVVSGMTAGAAAVAIGMEPAKGKDLLADPTIEAAVNYFRERNREKLDFSIETAHTMLMEAWSNSANSTEQVAVVRELIKLHGIAAAPKAQEVNVKVVTAKQLERASDAQLLEAAGLTPDNLLPVRRKRREAIVDAAFTEVKAQDG